LPGVGVVGDQFKRALLAVFALRFAVQGGDGPLPSMLLAPQVSQWSSFGASGVLRSFMSGSVLASSRR
jgi:hypothetical protein